MEKKISFFSMFLFLLASPYVIFSYFYIPLLIKNNGNLAYLVPLILLMVSFIIIALLPKKINQIAYLQKIKKGFLSKVSFTLFLFLSSLINLFITARIISELFFYEHHYILFVLILVGITLFLSRNSCNVLVNATTILLLIGFGLKIIPYFLATEVKDYTLLLPMKFNFMFESILFGAYLIMETIMYCFLFEEVEGKMNKKSMLILTSMILLFFTIELFQVIILVGTTYFNDVEFLGYLTFFIQDTITYVGNSSFICLFLIPVISVFKCAILLSIFKDVLKIKSVFLNDLIIALTFILSIIFMYKVSIFEFLKTYLAMLLILMTIVYSFIIVNRGEKYEIIF